MLDSNILDFPEVYSELLAKTAELNFSMPSDVYIGTLLKTLISSKPDAHFLELGTGMGLSLSWMLEGLNEKATLISVDNDPELISIVGDYVNDKRVQLECMDGADWIMEYDGPNFDLIFADAWPGKYSHLDEVISLLKVGGFYVIDDMRAQPNWPDGHQDNVDRLVNDLEDRDDLVLTKLNWSTGLIIASKVASN